MLVAKIVATIKMLPIYECNLCKKQRVGHTNEMRLEDVLDLNEAVRSAQPSPHGMPVGWASYSDGFKCEECLT